MKIENYLTSGEAVEFLSQRLKQKVTYYDLDNLLRSESIEPPKKIGGRRFWNTEKLNEAARALRIRRAKRPELTEKRRLDKQEDKS